MEFIKHHRSLGSIHTRAFALDINDLSAANANHLTEDAMLLIKTNYIKLGAVGCFKLLNEKYSIALISKYARSIGAKYSSWSADEDTILLANYTIDKVSLLKDLLPDHSLDMCKHRAKIKFGLDYPSSANYWTEAEDEVLRQHYSIDGVEACCKLLPNRTKGNICCRASKLGIHYTGKVYKEGKVVRCIETGEVFPRIKEAKEKYHGDIGAVVNGRQKAIRLKDGTKLHWEYVDKE